jgi:hypothetical protein
MQKTIIPSTPVLIEDLGMLYPTEKSTRKTRHGKYKCECGKEFIAKTDDIKSGNTKSCGCYSIKRRSDVHTNHGMYKHPLHYVWQGMLQRCYNKKRIEFQNYGGRGIIVCERWLNIHNFIEDMYPTYQFGLTIDRINNNGNYEPLNCRWVSRTVQSRNTRLIISTNTSGYRGVSFDASRNKWCSKIKVEYKTIFLGRFETSIEAAKAYDNYVINNNLEHTINGGLSDTKELSIYNSVKMY